MRLTCLALFALVLLAPPVLGDRETKERIGDFKKRFAPGMTRFTREKAINELAEVLDPAVMGAFDWALGETGTRVRKLIFEKDDNAKDLKKLEEQIAKIGRQAAERAKKDGRPPPKHIQIPASLSQAHADARAKAERLQKSIDLEYELRKSLAGGLGQWLTALAGADRTEILEKLQRSGLRSRDWAVRAFYALALGKTPLPEATRLLLARIAEEKDNRVLPIVIDALAEQGGEEAVPALLARLLDERWQVRVATVAALGKIRSLQSIQPLIDRLRLEPGRLRGDIADALKAITGQDLGISPDRWQTWWDANKSSFVPPKPPEPEKPVGGDEPKPAGPEPGPDEKPAPDPEEPDAPPPPPAGRGKGGGASFYGIRVVSKSILFVIDVSGSMNDTVGAKEANRTKISVAKYELKNALLSLPEDAKFNIVFYSPEVSQWRKGMVKAGKKEKRAAVKFVDAFEAAGGTNIHDALKQAFHLVGMGSRDKNYDIGADTIFFLSDGNPTVGEVLDPNQILAKVKRWNELRRVKIHTVGVGGDHDASFMKALADSSGGIYVNR